MILSVNLSRNSILNYHKMHLKNTTPEKGVVAPFSKYSVAQFPERLWDFK